MAVNEVNDVSTGIRGALAEVKNAGAEVVAAITAKKNITLDKLHRIQTGMCQDWDAANASLDEFDTSNGPEGAVNQGLPLDETK